MGFFSRRPSQVLSYRGSVIPGSDLPEALLDLSEAPVGWSLSAPSWKFNKNDSSKLRPGGVAVPFWPVATEVALRGFEVVPNDLPAMTCEVMRYEGGKAGELIELWDRTLRSHPDWNQRQLGTYNARCHVCPSCAAGLSRLAHLATGHSSRAASRRVRTIRAFGSWLGAANELLWDARNSAVQPRRLATAAIRSASRVASLANSAASGTSPTCAIWSESSQ
jgi:hypothetical protein